MFRCRNLNSQRESGVVIPLLIIAMIALVALFVLGFSAFIAFGQSGPIPIDFGQSYLEFDDPAGIEADTVIPNFSPMYALAAPNSTEITIPRRIALRVTSGIV